MGPGSTRCTAAVPGRPNSVYSYHVPQGNISVALHGAAAVTTRNAPRQKESGRDWCDGGCRPRPQVAGQKPNLALIPGDSAKVAEVVYCDAAGVQLAEGAFGSRANRNPQSGDSAIFGRCSNMPASTSPRGHFFHRQGEPPVSNWAGGYRQPDVAHLAGPVSVRLPRSSNNPQQGGVSRVLFFPTIPPFPEFSAAGRGPAAGATSGETSTASLPASRPMAPLPFAAVPSWSTATATITLRRSRPYCTVPGVASTPTRGSRIYCGLPYHVFGNRSS